MWPEAVVKCFVAIGAIGASLVLSRVIRTLVIYRRIRKIPGQRHERPVISALQFLPDLKEGNIYLLMCRATFGIISFWEH